jgi:hypothetical protein
MTEILEELPRLGHSEQQAMLRQAAARKGAPKQDNF